MIGNAAVNTHSVTLINTPKDRKIPLRIRRFPFRRIARSTAGGPLLLFHLEIRWKIAVATPLAPRAIGGRLNALVSQLRDACRLMHLCFWRFLWRNRPTSRSRSGARRNSLDRGGCWRRRCSRSRTWCGNLCMRASEEGDQTNQNAHADDSEPRPYSHTRDWASELNGFLFHC